MYKLLLCWRYLRTRHIALASVISVTLGVATMIVVNSVMHGFTREMQDRIHGIISDVVCESQSLEGFPNPQWHVQRIEQVAGRYIAAMTATVQVPAMLSFQLGNEWITRPVQLIGVDERTQSSASDFGIYLQHPANRKAMSFQLRVGGYDMLDHQAPTKARPRAAMRHAGWPYRRARAARDKAWRAVALQRAQANEPRSAQSTPPDSIADPFAGAAPSDANLYDAAREQSTGIVAGIALASYRDAKGHENFLFLPGDDVKVSFPSAGTPPRVVSDVFTVVDFYESKMSEYDSTLVFVPLSRLQQLRGMVDPTSGVGYVTSIQIKLKDDRLGPLVRDKLRAAFPSAMYAVSTWRDKQGPLLAAVQLETNILNLLLFLIIAVAGFGILAIFFMIVVEKTRDIGVLKSLGAPGGGVMSIFLTYGLSLGMCGSGVGLLIGLLIVRYINEIAGALGKITGHEIFDPSIYYFYEIPTIVDPWTVLWIVLGAIGIAVVASILPARRAARLHPVEALRYE